MKPRDNRPRDSCQSIGCAMLRVVAVSAVVAIFTGGIDVSRAAGQEIDARREANVKAVFLYSFGRYVHWPKVKSVEGGGDQTLPFVIGVIGASNEYFSTAMERIAATRKIEHRPIRVKRYENAEQIHRCDILFVSADVSAALKDAVFERLQDQPVLIVGETPGFAKSGGVINFYVSNGTVRFEINDQTAHLRRLKLHAKLLNLGRRVE